MPVLVHMTLLHLHLLSDSTGETLEMIAKAALAQFDDAEVIRHFWPMVRSLHHLDRIVEDLSANPGLVLYTLVNDETRRRLEEHCRKLGLPHVAPLDTVTAPGASLIVPRMVFMACRNHRSGAPAGNAPARWREPAPPPG